MVACHTPDYEGLAELWQASFKMREGLEPVAIEYEDQGGWIRNTLRKPIVAFEAWVAVEECRRPLWLFDCDIQDTGRGDMKELFSLLDKAPAAIHFHDLQKDPRRDINQFVSAGVVGFANTPAGVAAMGYWAQFCREMLCDGWHTLHMPEQAALWWTSEFLGDHGTPAARIPLKFNARPESAGKPFDLPDAEIVCSHVPASRAWRRKPRKES